MEKQNITHSMPAVQVIWTGYKNILSQQHRRLLQSQMWMPLMCGENCVNVYYSK